MIAFRLGFSFNFIVSLGLIRWWGFSVESFRRSAIRFDLSHTSERFMDMDRWKPRESQNSWLCKKCSRFPESTKKKSMLMQKNLQRNNQYIDIDICPITRFNCFNNLFASEILLILRATSLSVEANSYKPWHLQVFLCSFFRCW